MHRFLTLAAGISVALGSASAFAAVERTWTDYQGTKVKARFLTITDGLVRMRQGKKPIAIPFHELSRADREFIREELRDKGEENLVPTIGELRQWTAHGETFEAEFVGPLKDDIIILRNDRPVTMSFSAFAEEDQNYVRRQLTSKGQAHLIPKAASETPAEGAAGGSPLAGGANFGASRFPSRIFGGGPAGGAMPAGGGSVPQYQPSGGVGAASAHGGAYGGHGAAAANPFGAAGSVPSYNPAAASAHASAADPFAGSRAGSGYAGSQPKISFPEVPNYGPTSSGIPTLPSIRMYKYCKNCKAQYPMDATHCTQCSGGFRWRRYSIFGAIIGGVVGIIGAVIKAIRS